MPRPHPNAIALIAGKSYRNAKKVLKEFGCTRSEKQALIRMAKKHGHIFQ